MSWLIDWFNALSTLQQILACVALPATLILIIQSVLLILGMGLDSAADVGTDSDVDGEVDNFGDAAGLRIFTVRGLVAMFSVGGWLGIAAVDLGAGDVAALLIAVVSGLIALFLVAFIIKLFLGLQEDGNLDARNAIACTGRVYFTVPAARKGMGKVTLTTQERLVEMDAVTDCGEDIKTDSMVQVVSVSDNVLVVRPISHK